VTHVIASKRDLEMIDWNYDFSELLKIKENDRYVAYEVPQAVLEGS
jgi:hypothetical protein